MIEFFKYKRKTLSYPDLAVVVKRVFPESKVTPRGEGERVFTHCARQNHRGGC